jgi:hypothetical protein
MDSYGWPQTSLTIAVPGGLYIDIIMVRYIGHKTALTIALRGGLYLAIIMDRYGGTQTAITIALPGGLYLAIIMAVMELPKLPFLYPCMEASN